MAQLLQVGAVYIAPRGLLKAGAPPAAQLECKMKAKDRLLAALVRCNMQEEALLLTTLLRPNMHDAREGGSRLRPVLQRRTEGEDGGANNAYLTIMGNVQEEEG